MITPVYIADGSRARFWSLSRAGHPKKSLAWISEKTMQQQTAWRLSRFPATKY